MASSALVIVAQRAIQDAVAKSPAALDKKPVNEILSKDGVEKDNLKSPWHIGVDAPPTITLSKAT